MLQKILIRVELSELRTESSVAQMIPWVAQFALILFACLFMDFVYAGCERSTLKLNEMGKNLWKMKQS